MNLFVIGCLRAFVGVIGAILASAVGMACGWVFVKIWKMVWREN